MTNIYELNPVYNSLYSVIGKNLGKDICWKITQLYQSELEKKVSVDDEEYMRAAQFRDESRDLAKVLIGMLELKYVQVPVESNIRVTIH